MENYENIEDLIIDHPDDCYITDEEICGYCGCDLWDIYYIFGRYKCDNCLKEIDFLKITE